MRRRLRTLVLLTAIATVFTVGPGCCTLRSDLRLEPPDTTQWDGIPQEELAALWKEAQQSGGILVVEPGGVAVGHRAAEKKTWMAADKLLKFFVYGDQPNWFPADVIRRTVCGPTHRWSYFWHLASGAERDLHPWLDGGTAFGRLLGDGATAVTTSRALDLAPCEEVHLNTSSCLYGEVTPTKGFDTWFCGAAGLACSAWLAATDPIVPPDLADADTLCMQGPFVLERAHGWRPEIHPAEVLWVRKAHDYGLWTLALLPDESRRFDKDKYYEKPPPAGSQDWQPWSRRRPVELWVAFKRAAGEPVVFDLAMKVLDKKPQPARQVALAPPPAGAFAALESELENVFIASKTWRDATSDGGERGFFVITAPLQTCPGKAVLLRLRGRRPNDAPPAAEFEGVRVPIERAVRPAVTPSVRLFGVARRGRAVKGGIAVNTLVRFDARRPATPEDETLSDKLNKALAGSAKDRQNAFGAGRPFRVEWEIAATRMQRGVEQSVDVRTMGIASPDWNSATNEVAGARFRGAATTEITVNRQRELVRGEILEDTLVSLGQLVLKVPEGVTVTGQGQVFYVGTEPLDLYAQGKPLKAPHPAVRMSLRYPPRRYDKAWELVAEVLSEINKSTAQQRLDRLKTEACFPAAQAQCTDAPLAAEVATALNDPVARWAVLRELEKEGRPFARFIWLFERALRWDGEVTDDERALMKALLS
jgi:hypothetical protein